MGQSEYYKLSKSSLNWVYYAIKKNVLRRTFFAGTFPTILKAFIYSSVHLSVMNLVLAFFDHK